MVNARIAVATLFQMTFQFPKPFFGSLFIGADAFDSENLNRFFDHANNAHPTIKFTHETSRNNISFLDTYTTCENGIMIAVPLICKKCSPLNV
jgi:hypothetical protein